MQWFDIDRKGLAQLLERKGKRFVLFELIQNAWDENTREVRVTLERIPGTPRVKLQVTDDNPEGFANLSHAFTLFAQSAKKSDAEKRGRFNLGEKLVLAVCDEAEISSTKGTMVFDADGRRQLRRKTERGSVFTGTLRMTNQELEDCAVAVRSLIVPPGIRTLYNGEELAARACVARAEATLPTEVADAEGQLRATQRKTVVEIHEPLPGETPMLYEMGLPVVETQDRWHLNVLQKVPLNFDRDNVPPAYLSRVRALALEALHERLTTEDANAPWVRDAIQRQAHLLADETIERVMSLRFGDKRVAYDPSDVEANHLAVAKGYTVVHGGQMAKTEWEAVRRAGALLPAGRVTPSPRPYSEDGQPQKLLPQEKWSVAMKAVAHYVESLGPLLLQKPVTVRMVSDVGWPFAAAYGSGTLTFNLGRLGHKWFSGPLVDINDLVLHEFGHQFASSHLSDEYHAALTRLGARLTQLALDQPGLFKLKTFA